MLIQSNPNNANAFPVSSAKRRCFARPAPPARLVGTRELTAGAAAAGVLVGVIDPSSGEPVIVEPFAGRVGPPNTPETKWPSDGFAGGEPVPRLEDAMIEGERLAKPTDGPGLYRYTLVQEEKVRQARMFRDPFPPLTNRHSSRMLHR